MRYKLSSNSKIAKKTIEISLDFLLRRTSISIEIFLIKTQWSFYKKRFNTEPFSLLHWISKMDFEGHAYNACI